MSDSIDYAALFGIEELGAEEQETADPAEDTTEPEGAEEQEIADPAEGSEENEAAGESPDESEESSEEESGGQSREENARYAAARRKAEAERDAEIERVKAEAQKAINEFYENSGLSNPYTGKPIKNKEEFDAYRQQFADEQKRNFLQRSGMGEEEFGNFVSGLPEVQQAREIKAEAEREKLEAQKAAADIKVAEQLKEIGKLDPTVKTLEDLSKTPTYHRLYELVRDNGLTLVDAFKLANMETLTQGAAAGARQAAMNAINGKKHMEQTRQRGAGAISIPADVMEEYRKLLPDATDEEIRADYAKRHRQ